MFDHPIPHREARRGFFTLALTALVFSLFMLGWALIGHAQDAPPPLPSDGGINSALPSTGGLDGLVISFALAHPWFLGFLAVLGTVRMLIKPIMTGLRYYANSTATKSDDALLDEVEHSWAYTAFLFALDWFCSIKVPAKSPDPALNKALKALVLFGSLAAVLSMTACAPLAPGGVYNGDQVLQKSELTISTAYDVIHAFVSWEKENRATLAKWPEIKKGADLMRSHAKQWFSTANALHDAYAANPTPENRDALATGLNVLSTAMSQATQYMAQAAQP
jgi:hypothetical protein